MRPVYVSRLRPFYYPSMEAASRNGEAINELIEVDVNPDLVGTRLNLLDAGNGNKALIGLEDAHSMFTFGRFNAGAEIAWRILFPAA